MIGTRTRKVFREVGGRRTRSAMVSLSVFIGVLGVVMLVSVGDILITRMEAGLHPEHLPMLTVMLDHEMTAAPEFIDHATLLESLRTFPEVSAVEAMAQHMLYWRDPDATGFVEGVVSTYEPWFDGQTLEPQRIMTGRLPIAGQHEIAIERRMAANYGLGVGDTVSIRILSALQGNVASAGVVPEENWTIVGIIADPYSFSDQMRRMVYATRADFDTITGATALDQLRVRFTTLDAAERFETAFVAQVEAVSPYPVSGHSISDPQHNTYLDNAQKWVTTLSALAIMAMLVSCFLVITVLMTIVAEQRRQIGVMKALGASRFDNFLMYAGIALTYGALGTLPGVLLGIPAGYLLAKMVAGMLNVVLNEFAVSITGITIGVLMGLLMPVLASIVPVWLGTRITILNAITDRGIEAKFGSGRISWAIGRLPGPLAARQAVANTYLRRWRLTLTGMALVLAAAAFMGVSALFLSLNGVAERMFNTYNYDLSIIPVNPATYDYAAVGNLIAAKVQGLEGLYPGTFLGLDVVRDDTLPATGDNLSFLYVGGFDPATDIMQLSLAEGRGWYDDPEAEGIVITEMSAATLGKDVGDTITVVVDDATYALPVLGIDTFPSEGGYMPWWTLAALNGSATPSEYWLRFAGEDVTGAEVDRQMGEIREMLVQHGLVARFRNQRAVIESKTQTVFTAGLICNIASGVMAAVGAIGLLVMAFVSVFERQREIGVMRSVGAQLRHIAAPFLLEGLLLTALAWAAAIPLSVGLARGLLHLLPLGKWSFTYPPLATLYGLSGMLLIGLLASLWPSMAAGRKTVSEILRYQ